MYAFSKAAVSEKDTHEKQSLLFGGASRSAMRGLLLLISSALLLLVFVLGVSIAALGTDDGHPLTIVVLARTTWLIIGVLSLKWSCVLYVRAGEEFRPFCSDKGAERTVDPDKFSLRTRGRHA